MDRKYGSPMVKDGAIGNTKMFQYEGKIRFTTDKELTERDDYLYRNATREWRYYLR